MNNNPHNILTYQSLKTDDVRVYMVAKGWQKDQDIGTAGSEWTLPQDDSAHVLLSHRPSSAEYGQRMAEAVQALARAERCTVEQVLEAITRAQSDVVRVQIDGPNELSLKRGVAAVEGLPKLLQAAACATLSTRAHYASRLPNEVRDYMDSLRLAQTEAGSFVLRVASPIPSPPAELPEQPFARRVTRKLITSLGVAARAAELTARDATSDAFDAAVVEGVSANLLDALVAFGQERDETCGFSVELDWASALPVADDTPRRVVFERDWVPAMIKAAEALRARGEDASREVTLVGTVASLNELNASTEETPRRGKIRLWAAVGDHLRAVEVELSGSDYQIAARAHIRECPIRLSGELDKQGGRWSLARVRDVELFEEAEEVSAHEGDEGVS